jgi:signal peptidase I
MRLAFWKKNNNTPKKKKVWWREWIDALVFAVVAATIIRTFFIEAYTIPTGSMEGSLLVNDYLFVSKMAYGPRVPNTPLAFPLVHNTMPITGGKSYSESIKSENTLYNLSSVIKIFISNKYLTKIKHFY